MRHIGQCKGLTVDTLADTLQSGKAETNFDTVRNVRVKALVDTLAETVADRNAKKPLDTLNDIKVKALMDWLANTLAEAEAELLADRLWYVETDKQVETLHDNLVEAEVHTLGDMIKQCQICGIGHAAFTLAVAEAWDECQITGQCKGAHPNQHDGRQSRSVISRHTGQHTRRCGGRSTSRDNG